MRRATSGCINHWAADHSMAPAGGVPLLALDMYEHAYQMDYGADAGKYVDSLRADDPLDHAPNGSIARRSGVITDSRASRRAVDRTSAL